MKKLIYITVIIILAVGGFFAFNKYIYNQKQAINIPEDLSSYFEERITILGISDVGQPIEGFDSNLIMIAFPGIKPIDFDGVEALEGSYKYENDEAVFVRTGNNPISSAERMVSHKGYETLIENISARLHFPVKNTSDVDLLVQKVNTGERIQTTIDQGASALGVKVIPHEVLEDSRCPVDVTCIQAGTVRVSATLEIGASTSTQEFKLDEPIVKNGMTVTMIHVDPESNSQVEIEKNDYIFYFEIKQNS